MVWVVRVVTLLWEVWVVRVGRMIRVVRANCLTKFLFVHYLTMPLAAGKNTIIILSFLDFSYLLDNFDSSHTGVLSCFFNLST